MVLCLLSDENCPLLGLVNFVMPLRTSNVPFNQLKDLVILGDPNYLEKEWASICTFPKIYVFPVSWCIMSFLIGERDIFDAYETRLYKLESIFHMHTSKNNKNPLNIRVLRILAIHGAENIPPWYILLDYF